MNEISAHRRPSKRRFVIGGAFTAGLAAGVAGVLLLNTADPAVNPKPPVGPATLVPYKLVASEVLLKASNAAAAAPDLQPKPGQYLYFHSKSHQPAVTFKEGQREQPEYNTDREVWLSVSGKNAGLLRLAGADPMTVWLCDTREQPGNGATEKGVEGKVDLANPPTNCQDRPAYSNSVPTDAAAAKEWLYKNSQGGNPPDVQAFITVGDTIRERYIGSKSLAALFKAAADIPGVKVYKNVTDSAGRKGIAVGQTWNGTRHQLIFDPKTFELRGESQVVDYNDDFQPSGGSTPKPSEPTSSPTGPAPSPTAPGAPPTVGGESVTASAAPPVESPQPSASAQSKLKQGQLLYSSANLGFALVDRVGQK
jgi:hypothetical protein